MTALNCLRQRSAVHMASDAAAYDGDGILECLMLKQIALPHLSCVIGTRGAHKASYLTAMVLSGLFRNFDDMIAGIEEAMPQIMDELPASELNPRCDLFIAGWSSERNRAESYFMQTADNAWRPDEGEQLAGDLMNPEPFKLVELPEASFTPAFAAEDMRAATPKGRVVRGMDDLNPEVDMLRVLEIQRQSRCARVPGGPQRHWVGGFAVLTSVSEHALTSRIIGRWDEDRIGEHIAPAAVNWDTWNLEHRLPGAPEQLSRLRQQMLEKKTRKLAR